VNMQVRKAVIAILVAASPAVPAAESAAADEVPEIVVTARRTSERLQDVPVAVTAFGGEALDQRSVDTLDQVARYTPNIRFDGAAALSGGNYNATVFIRGVGQNDFAIFSDPGVGFYVDDVYYARSIGGVMDAVDIESVQVLRGPQGTLFGRNTIGGAVLITTGTPDVTGVSGKAEVTVGRFDRRDGKLSLNLPFADGRAALRFSVAALNRDGYVDRLFDGGTQGDRSAQVARVKLRVLASDTVTIDLGADYTRARETSAPSDLLAVGNAPGITGIPFLVNYNAAVAPTLGIVAPNGQPTLNPSFLTASPFQTWAGGPNDNDLDLWGAQGTVTWELPGATLKSVTAYRDMRAWFTRDGDNTPFTFRETTNRDDQWQFSEELQLTGKLESARLSYVLGAFYFKEKATDIATADLAIGLWSAGGGNVGGVPGYAGPQSPAVYIDNTTDNRSLAAYGQVEWEFVPRWSATLGARYTDDDKTFTSINSLQRNLVEFINVTREGSFKKFTPRAGLTFKASDDLMLYASYSRGFKQGGFNGRPLAGPQEVTAYEPETLDTWEAGVKAQWFDRRLTTNLAVFHSKYEDIQLTVNQTPQNFVANAAKGEINGFEFEAVARPSRWLSFNAAVGYTDASYDEVGQGLGPTQILPITVNSKFVKAPEWTTTVGLDLTRDFANGGSGLLRVDYTSYSRIYHDVANTPLITDDGYGLLNARLTYSLPGDALQVSVFGTNLTDELYLVSGNASGAFGLAEASYGRPREYGVTLSYRF
jgi:iron complex outermembrane receptor protein